MKNMKRLSLYKIIFFIILLILIVGVTTFFTYEPFSKTGQLKIENIDGKLYQVQDYTPNWGQKGGRATSTNSTSTTDDNSFIASWVQLGYARFQYIQGWGKVSEHDEGADIHVIRIARDSNECIPVFGPDCKVSPDVQLFFQKGNHLDQFNNEWSKLSKDTIITVGGFTAHSYDIVGPINDTPNATIPVGYNKVVLVGLQKSDQMFVEVAFTSPTFKTKSEAQSYSTSDFKNFLSNLDFPNVIKK